jgi:hypothetical protein
MKNTHPIINPGSADPDNLITRPTARPLKIFVVFDDEASARSAEVLIQHTASDLPCDVQSFAFDKLDPPGPGVAAARNASDCDVLLVAVRDDRALPGHMKLWLGLCLGLRDRDLGGLLVALIRKAEEMPDPESSLIDYLSTVATIGGLAFFPQREFERPEETMPIYRFAV